MPTLSWIMGFLLAFGGLLPTEAQPQPSGKLWSYDAGAPISSSPALATDGAVYIAAGSSLLALTNAGRWESNKWTFAAQVAMSPAVASDGIIYFGARDAQCSVYAVRPDGSLYWSTPLQPEFQYQISHESTPAISADGTLYLVAGGRLYSISRTGKIQWEFVLGPESGPFPLSPVIGSDGTVYVGSTSVALFAINPNGTKRWSSGTLSGGPGESAAIVGSAALCYPAALLYSFAANGTSLWTTDYNYYRSFVGSPVVSEDGALYVPTSLSTPLSRVSVNGDVQWFALGPCSPNATSPAVDAAGRVYYCVSNTIWAVSPQGHVYWGLTSSDSSSPQQPDLATTSPIIGPDGTLYAALGTKLYAIATGTNGPANSSWPMYHQNARHTGKMEKPFLKEPQKRSDSNFEFQLYPQLLGVSYTIESSTNLQTWVSLTSFVANSFPVGVADLTATNSEHRFYRAFSAP